VRAPAKLTLSLRITGVRPDGYHLIDAEMVTLDLADTLSFAPGNGLVVESTGVPGAGVVADDAVGSTAGSTAGGAAGGVQAIPIGPDNLVNRALRAVDREAAVRLIKRIPAGAGLGGGSADAAAVLRWAGCPDLPLAARLGADVPFCLVGGRAQVAGIGEQVTPLPYVKRSFVLLLLPFGVETAAVYGAWDRLERAGSLPPAGTVVNELEAPALVVEPRMSAWRDRLGEVTGAEPCMAGSGSTWFVEGTPEGLGLEGHILTMGKDGARLVSVTTTPTAD
jgi:4-diphosphocytidyl-2-C-methyl-D-erythritol kinase